MNIVHHHLFFWACTVYSAILHKDACKATLDYNPEEES